MMQVSCPFAIVLFDVVSGPGSQVRSGSSSRSITDREGVRYAKCKTFCQTDRFQKHVQNLSKTCLLMFFAYPFERRKRKTGLTCYFSFFRVATKFSKKFF
jgi:hypothetical protein